MGPADSSWTHIEAPAMPGRGNVRFAPKIGQWRRTKACPPWAISGSELRLARGGPIDETMLGSGLGDGDDTRRTCAVCGLRHGSMTGERVVRRLAAIPAADVAGYSRLMGRDEHGADDRP
jgi:hypothetical protein